ncbi:MAG: carbohydrate porin [Myxococcales bacterium]
MGRRAKANPWAYEQVPTIAPSSADSSAILPLEEETIPTIIGDGWRNGRAEVDDGQGILGKLYPHGIEWLAEHGVQLFGWYMIATQGNPVGGQDRAFRYTGLWDFGLDLDMGTMANLHGLWIHVSGSWASGKNLSTDIGTFAPVNTVYSGKSMRFFEAYLEQRMFGDRLSIRVGRVSVGWEYGLEYEYFTQYLSGVFRLNVFSLAAATPNFAEIPYSNWGMRVRYTPNLHWRLQASFMNGYPQDFSAPNKHGLDFKFQPQKGSFFIVEGSYQWVPSDEERNRNPGRLPGRLILGAYYDTGPFDLVNGTMGTDRGLATGYAIVRQKLWEPALDSSRGLVGWTSATVSGKQNIVELPWFWSGGLVWTGLIPRRHKDVLAFGFANEFFSKDVPNQSYEITLEAAYSVNATTWITLTPDFQYIVNPGGTHTTDNAFIAGMLTYLTF